MNEWGWHVGLGYWSEMGDRRTLAYPLTRIGKLWQFSFNTDISLIDVASPAASQHFGYPSHAPFNPHADRYTATQHLATSVSAYHNPNMPQVHHEGILAPSVRTIPRFGYTPTQIVLFAAPPLQGLPVPLAQRAVLLTQWDVELEFCTPGSDQSVTANDAHIAWASPWVRLSGPMPVPRFTGRSGSTALAVNNWFTLDVRHTQH